MSGTILITGGGGFVGQWLARALLQRGDVVWLSGLGQNLEERGILSGSERAKLQWRTADMRRDDDLRELISASRPDAIAHLAGISYVPEAERGAAAAYEVNVIGAVRLLNHVVAARESGECNPAVLIVGSGTQYGTHETADMPLQEDAEQRPASTYAATKCAQEIAALQIARAQGLRVMCARSFSHSGRGQDSVFLLPSLARRALELRSKAGTLPIGNDVVRDYLHVSDVAEAYISLLDHGRAGECYNVCSGEGVAVRQLAETAIRLAGVSAGISTAAEFQRPSDMPVLVGSPQKLMRATGWRPRRTVQDIFDDLLTAS